MALSIRRGGRWRGMRQVLVRRMRLRDEICPDTPWVFFHTTPTRNASVGDRVKNVRRSFTTACRRAEIEDFHIHDLRHTFASWLVMNGVPLFEVSKLLRHSCIQMTERYAHLGLDHLHNAVANLGFYAHLIEHTVLRSSLCWWGVCSKPFWCMNKGEPLIH